MKDLNYNFVEDIDVFKTVLNYNDQEIFKLFNVPKASMYRYYKNNNVPSKDVLGRIYNCIFDKGVILSKIYEDIFKTKENKNNLILFHGSKEGIHGKLSTKYSNENRDFGRAFYVGESMNQAISFISEYEDSSVYVVEIKNINKLKVVELDVSKEWMIMIAYFRGRLDEYKESSLLKKTLNKIKDADIIISPIADNSMYSTINEFIEGTITDQQCLNSIAANRLGKQYVIRNDKILNNNVFLIKKVYISTNERNNFKIKRSEDKNIGKAKMILAKRKYAGKGKYIEELLKNG